MLILISWPFSIEIKSSLVNWLPWSLLKISGILRFLIASFKASMENEAVKCVLQPQ